MDICRHICPACLFKRFWSPTSQNRVPAFHTVEKLREFRKAVICCVKMIVDSNFVIPFVDVQLSICVADVFFTVKSRTNKCINQIGGFLCKFFRIKLMYSHEHNKIFYYKISKIIEMLGAETQPPTIWMVSYSAKYKGVVVADYLWGYIIITL